jgi:hypothetical protein
VARKLGVSYRAGGRCLPIRAAKQVDQDARSAANEIPGRRSWRAEKNMIDGSCLCGQVKYEISGSVGDIVHCHCRTCRKAHGSAFSSVASVDDVDFKLIGADSLKSYESSSGKKRYFCSNCGTQIYAKRNGTRHIVLRLGSLDDAPGSMERCHIWVSQKADWYSINADLPEHREFE